MFEEAGMAMGLGALIKHLVPWKKINRFIPLINFGASVGWFMSQGQDIGTALTSGLTTALMATGGHQVIKTTANGAVGVNGQSV